MRVATAAAHRNADRIAIAEWGVPGTCLMQSAGEALVRGAADVIGSVAGRRIALLCGPGNNGGDGFAAARLLHAAGADVSVVLGTEASRISGDSKVHFRPLAALNIPIVHGPGDTVQHADLLVDCLLGTGSSGAPRGAVAALIEAATQAPCPIVACDIPSGVDSDTGAVPGIAITANLTVALTGLKPGLLLHPGAAHAGRIRVAPLGIAESAFPEPTDFLTTSETVRALLPTRAQHRDANKGSFGKVLVVAGSRGMTGAAVLAATSALRTGAGLVWLAVPESCVGAAATLAPEVVLRPLPETDAGTHGGPGALDILMDIAQSASAVAIGPGLGRHPACRNLVRDFLSRIETPAVVDADGLNAISPLDGPPCRPGKPPVLTPHPGEMASLLGTTAESVQSDRLAAVRAAADIAGAVVLLKGARTLIAQPSGIVHYNREGTPALATAGSGDVLTGMIAALLASGLPPVDSARAAAYVHATAGSFAAPAPFPGGALATEIRDHIPGAQRALLAMSAPTDDEPCLI